MAMIWRGYLGIRGGLWLLAWYSVLLGVCCSAARAMDPPPTITLSPGTVQMGAFYNGIRLHIEGTVPANAGVLVALRGVAKDEVFNKKGRVGLIWVNTDKVHITGPPSLLLRFSSEEVHSLLNRENIDAYVLDEAAVRHTMQVRTKAGEPDPAYRKLIEDSYLQLKKADGNYRKVSDRVQIVQEGGIALYSLAFTWPKTAPPGSYQVEVYACRNGEVIAHGVAVLPVVEAGFPAFLANMAHNHPAGYGLMAVLMAVIAGFGIDAVASRLRPRKRHVRLTETPRKQAEQVRAASVATGEKP
jgi:uncharacterized protein (TIGR02186 family)